MTKNFGHIPHLVGSRLGQHDHYITEGQTRIATVKARDCHDRIVVQEKLDGCLPWRTKIKTDQGDIAIGKIVNQQLPVLVASYNIETDTVEYKPILGYHKQARTSPWIRFKYNIDGNNGLICTENHKIYTKSGYVEARDITLDTVVTTLVDQYSIEAQQVILGSLLGDGTLCRPSDKHRLSFSFSQGIQHSNYFNFICKFLAKAGKEQKICVGGYPGSKQVRRFRLFNTPALHSLLLNCWDQASISKKRISRAWLDRLNPLALAIWYCDDGSCQFSYTQRPRSTLHTQGFNEDEVQQLVDMLWGRFRVKGDKYYYNGWQITLTADGTERFFDLICAFMPQSMSYKLPERYRIKTGYWDHCTPETYKALVEVPIRKIELNPTVHEHPDTQYDLTIQDNHNYFAGQILVHNSNVGVWKINGELIPVTRSGNPCRKSTYLHHHYFADWVFKHYDRFNSLLSEGERVAGEWLALAHGTRYFPERVLGWEPFVAFDIFTPANLRITYENFYTRAQGVFKTPPLVSYGSSCSIEFARAMYPKSLYGGEHVEGFIWRVERLGKVDFLCKWVDSAYSPGCLLDELIWNWKPHD